jgi:PAS domain S-box-containing protein
LEIYPVRTQLNIRRLPKTDWWRSVGVVVRREKKARKAGQARRGLLAQLQLDHVELAAQKEALRETQLQHDHYFRLYEHAPIGHITIDQNGRILEHNQTAAAVLGVNKELLSSANISKFVNPRHQDKWNAQREAAFAQDGKHVFEIEMRKADRTALQVRLEGIVLGPKNDRRCIFALIDITERKSAEEALNRVNAALERSIEHQTAEIRLQAEAIAHIADGVMVTAGLDWTRSTIRFVNDAMCSISGYHRSELVGKMRSMLHGRRTDSKTVDRIRRELFGGKSSRAELIQYRKNNEPYVAELSITPVPNQEAGRITFVSVHRDITERKRAEQELEQYRMDLRTITRELIRAEERERRRLAEDLHDGLGQAIFRARTKIDQLSVDEPKVAEAGAILEEVGRMVNAMTFQLNPPVLRQLGLRAAIRSLSREMQQRYGFSVEFDDDGREIPLAEEVALALFRAVRELSINAAKHAETARARISLRRLGHRVHIVIKDQGKGFNPDDRSRHVEAGHFGLFSIRERLQHIGGTFNIHSARGKGTSVTLTAPLMAGRRRR